MIASHDPRLRVRPSCASGGRVGSKTRGSERGTRRAPGAAMRISRSISCAAGLLFALLHASALPACGSDAMYGTPPDGSVDGTTDGSPNNACTTAGGFCLSGASCPTGYRRDDGALSCPSGPGLGIANQPCCVPDSFDAGEVHAPRPLDYSQKCAVDADCELIDDSTNPCCPGCMSAAIAKADDAKYKADLSRFRSTCKEGPPCPGRGCNTFVAKCTGGTCQAIACTPTCPGTDAGTDGSGGG